MADIKETKEAVTAALQVGLFVVSRLKDGADLSDAYALGAKLMDPDFRKLVQDGIDGADLIPDELSDLSFMEGAELLQAISTAIAQSKAA